MKHLRSMFFEQKIQGYGTISVGFFLLFVFAAFHRRLVVEPPLVWLSLLFGGTALLAFGISLLILERKALFQKAAEQEKLLRFLLEYIPDHVYFKDRKSRFIGGSRSLAQYFGLERVEDLIGKTDFDFFASPHAEEAYADEQRILTTGETIVNKVERETWPDGRTSWVLTTKVPFRNDKGEIIGIVGISKDLTELKEKEEALERERQFLNSVFEGIQDGLSVLDRNFTILRVNSFMERLYEEAMPLVGKKCYEAYYGRQTPCFFCPTIPAMATGKKVTHVVPYMKQGEVRGWLELTAYPFFDRDGKVLGVIEYVKDVTDRITVEDALRENERKFRTLTRLAPAAIVIYQDNHFVWCNEEAERLTGYSQEELLSLSPDFLVHPDFRERVRKNVALRQEGKEGELQYEVKIVRKDGEERWILIRGATIRYQGRYAGLAVCLDITQEKEREARLLHLNAVLKSVRNVNQLITREKNRKKLVQGICRELVEGCGYTGSCVVLFPRNGDPPHRVALGFSEEALEAFSASCDLERAREELKELTVKKVQKITSEDPCAAPFVYLLRPNEGLFVAPLEWGETQYGFIVASLPLSFLEDEEEEMLFLELSQDLSFALYSIDLEKARQEAQKVLEASEEKFRTLAESLPVAVLIRTKGEWAYINPFFEALTGYEPKALTRSNLWLEIAPEGAYIINQWEQGLGLVPFEREFTLVTSGSQTKWVLARFTPVRYKDEEALLVLLLDLTERKLAEERIRYLTFHDILTGLYNRTFFEHEISRLDVPENLPLSVIMGDLNGLKLVNDAFGHAMGDELLRQAARILEKVCSNRGIVARLGGDEFVVLLPHTSSAEVQAIGEQIQREFRKAQTGSIPLSISLGYGTKVTPEQPFDEILRIAENWMYQRKLTESLSFHNQVLQAFRASLRAVTQETEEHSQRIRNLALQLGKALGLSQRELDELSLLAEFHDIGKIAIPQSVLEKPGPLDEEEWAIVKKHPEVGFRITQSIWELSSIANYILFHHERFDGTGYPRGLKGEDIPLLSRIIAICDAYDAMVTGRPYRKARTKEEAIVELRRCSGTQFDPNIVETFVAILEGLQSQDPSAQTKES
ncbi:MAG: PAS domain S-box protein [Candidatus Caldatribacterium sp.]|uniref:PAS domain S-box protein n=1 Tax=Candidatus Caldatribacterium sp. TaxID=2282143 RepID=UPI0029959784|nr:PAS domain S-box protein [Candidatus Caldatribacterium sp.]MCX7730298.1 PAS domain S-box protein [Candidatus Caldatribacterium sp.]MDW8080358.1 PAS domain S-box protein [Candidatus Calescibacterium sp.]